MALDLQAVMVQAVEACLDHVDGGGLPFVGVVVSDTGVISEFGVNLVHQTGDPQAHAEVVAMRDALASHGLTTLAGTTLVATGEPCGLCYRYAIDRGIDEIHVAVDRDMAADWGFDYRTSYPAFGVSEHERASLLHRLPIDRGTEPFTRFLQKHLGH